jgi:hypothetical protein
MYVVKNNQERSCGSTQGSTILIYEGRASACSASGVNGHRDAVLDAL